MDWLLTLAALCTAVLSGVFGMAGGMILMGVYAAVLQVATAMVLHGTTQLAANGLRAGLLWRSIYTRGFAYYVAGALLAFAALAPLRYEPEPAVVFLGLGLAPMTVLLGHFHDRNRGVTDSEERALHGAART